MDTFSNELKPNCVHCGTAITAITYRINDGFCMPCRDPFPAITGPKHLLDVVSETEVDAELATLGLTAGATFHRWLRIKSRIEPRDHLRRFRADLQSPWPVVPQGVVWRRGSETLSGIVTHTEWLTAPDEWLGERLRFATQDELAACPTIRDNLQDGDRVVHYQNDDPEGIAEDGRAGLVLVRNRRCVVRVRIERARIVPAPCRDVAQLEFGLAV